MHSLSTHNSPSFTITCPPHPSIHPPTYPPIILLPPPLFPPFYIKTSTLSPPIILLPPLLPALHIHPSIRSSTLQEAFIRELVRSGGEADVTKRKCQVKMSRLEKEVHRARQLHQETQHQLKVRSKVICYSTCYSTFYSTFCSTSYSIFYSTF